MKTLQVCLAASEIFLHNTNGSFAEFTLEKQELYFGLKMHSAKQEFLVVCFSKMNSTQLKKSHELPIFMLFMFTMLWDEFTLANTYTQEMK